MELKFLRSYTFTVAAGASEVRDVTGDFFNVIASDQDTFNVAFDNGPHIAFEQGFSGRVVGDAFHQVTVQNPNASSLTVTLILGFGELRDNKATISGSIAIEPSATITGANVSVETTATVIKAANTSRKRLSVRNVGAATVYLGPATVTTANGYPLEVDETAELESTAALYGIVAAGTVDVRYIEEV